MDKTTTTTQTATSRAYGTVTVTASARGMERQPGSLVNSIIDQVVSQQYRWDLTRFNAMPMGCGKSAPKGPGGEEGEYWTWWIARRLTTDAYGLGTYDGRPSDECTNTGEWRDAQREVKSSILIYNVEHLTVFGDSSCSYKPSSDNTNPGKDELLGNISCSKWKDAKCYSDLESGGICGEDYLFRMAYCNWK